MSHLDHYTAVVDVVADMTAAGCCNDFAEDHR